MKRICLFSHFFTEDYIPNYVIYYLEKLKEISEVYLLTNIREINNLFILDELGIKYFLYDNYGFDFGMYYKFFQKNDIDCDQLIIANDSMILFNDLLSIDKWIKDNENVDMLGITDSIEISYHLQSYFLVMNKKVQIEFIKYLNENGELKEFSDVVNIYEVEFSRYLLLNGFTLKSKYKYIDYTDKLRMNPIIFSSKKLIYNEISMIKRKVVFKLFKNYERDFLRNIGFDFSVNHWDYIIDKTEENLNINYLKEL